MLTKASYAAAMQSFTPGCRLGMKSFWKAAATSIALSALFFVVYPFCNWVASRRPHVPTVYFHWERSIPFVPAFIIPYTSMNVFFVAAPFFAASDRHRVNFSRQIVVATLIAGICFLLIPMRFALPTPQVQGSLGRIFDWLHALDRPYNEFPSLHVAFCVILANLYLRRCHGVIRFFLAIWFALIILSTLLTYQHHAVDVLGGITTAGICMALFRDDPSWQNHSHYGSVDPLAR
jgi:membrane-associated phospholipid phosphatase